MLSKKNERNEPTKKKKTTIFWGSICEKRNESTNSPEMRYEQEQIITEKRNVREADRASDQRKIVVATQTCRNEQNMKENFSCSAPLQRYSQVSAQTPFHSRSTHSHTRSRARADEIRVLPGTNSPPFSHLSSASLAACITTAQHCHFACMQIDTMHSPFRTHTHIHSHSFSSANVSFLLVVVFIVGNWVIINV